MCVEPELPDSELGDLKRYTTLYDKMVVEENIVSNTTSIICYNLTEADGRLRHDYHTTTVSYI